MTLEPESPLVAMRIARELDLDYERDRWAEEQAEAAYYEQKARDEQAAVARVREYDPDDRHFDARGISSAGFDDRAEWRDPEDRMPRDAA